MVSMVKPSGRPVTLDFGFGRKTRRSSGHLSPGGMAVGGRPLLAHLDGQAKRGSLTRCSAVTVNLAISLGGLDGRRTDELPAQRQAGRRGIDPSGCPN
jgi:hypothetical protein